MKRKVHVLSQFEDVWEQKTLYGRYTQRIKNVDIDINKVKLAI